jgi:hypothetical protein
MTKMKTILHLIALCLVALSAPLHANDASRKLDLVRVSISSDLVKDFPIDVTATTTGKELRFTFGPKPDGQYCTIDAMIRRLDGGDAEFIVTFKEETKVVIDQSHGIRHVGFDQLSTVLSPGEEDVLFSMGGKTFVIKRLRTP